MTGPAPLSYSIAQRVVHWLSVLLVFYNLLFTETMEEWGERIAEGYKPTPEDISSANIHAYVGMAILALLVIRLALRRIQGVPEAPAAEPASFRIMASIGHGALYLLLLIMPLAGIAAYYFDSSLAGTLHGGPMKLLLWILLIVHIAAVLVHKFVWKTNVLERMTKGV
jgi:cytochrome b561